MLRRVARERIRHELYLILREREPERALGRLNDLNVLTQISPHLVCTEDIRDLFPRLRRVLTEERWIMPSDADGRPTPDLYLALLTHNLSPSQLEALADRLRIFHDDLNLLREVLDLRELEPDLDQSDLSDRELYHLLRGSKTAALMIRWLCTGSERVRECLWHYETKLRHVRPSVNGAYLRSLGLKPSPLFSRLLNAIRDAHLDGSIQTEQDEKALLHQLLEELGKA